MDAYVKDYDSSPAEVPSNNKCSGSAMFGVTALFIGIVALALAALPMLIFDRPTPSFRASNDVVDERPQSRFSFTWKNFKFSFGGAKQTEDEAAREALQRAAEEARAADNQAILRHEARLSWFALASAGFALLGLAIGPIAWARERHPALAGCAMVISGVALLWQFIVVGIIVGVALLIVLAFVSSIGS